MMRKYRHKGSLFVKVLWGLAKRYSNGIISIDTVIPLLLVAETRFELATLGL